MKTIEAGRSHEAERIQKDKAVMDGLISVFRKYGYDAASLSKVEEATGLKKSSLYYRFPEGKAQMAREVIESRGEWLRENLFRPLREKRLPEVRIREMLRFVNRHYEQGAFVCLLGLLALSESSGQYGTRLAAVFDEWIESLAQPLIDGGLRKADAIKLSQMTLTKIQGALLMTRALGTNRPFLQALKSIRAELLQALSAAIG